MIAISGGNGFLGKHCKIFCKINKLEDVVFVDRENFKDKQILKNSILVNILFTWLT